MLVTPAESLLGLSTRGQSYRSYTVIIYELLYKARVFVLGKPFQRNLWYCIIGQAPDLAWKYQTRLGRVTRDSSLLQKFENAGRSFLQHWPRVLILQDGLNLLFRDVPNELECLYLTSHIKSVSEAAAYPSEANLRCPNLGQAQIEQYLISPLREYILVQRCCPFLILTLMVGSRHERDCLIM